MGRHHRPHRERVGGGRSGDLSRGVCGVGVMWVCGGDGGDLGEGGKKLLLLYKRLPSTYDYHTCIGTLLCPGAGKRP